MVPKAPHSSHLDNRSKPPIFYTTLLQTEQSSCPGRDSVLGAQGTAQQPPPCRDTLLLPTVAHPKPGALSSALPQEPAQLAWPPEEQLERNFLPRGIAAFDCWFCGRALLLTNSPGQLAGEMRPHWMARHGEPKWQDYTSSSLKQMGEIRMLVNMIKQNCMCMKHA